MDLPDCPFCPILAVRIQVLGYVTDSELVGLRVAIEELLRSHEGLSGVPSRLDFWEVVKTRHGSPAVVGTTGGH